jgi:hypothetical protein
MNWQSFALLRLVGSQKKVNVKTKARDVSYKQLAGKSKSEAKNFVSSCFSGSL